MLLGRDTFSTGRIGAATMDAAIRALAGFKQVMDGYGVTRVCAVATSAVREASNAEMFLDRIRVRVGLNVDVIDGSEESRLTYLAVSDRLAGHPALESRLHLADGSRRRQRRCDPALARRAGPGGCVPARAPSGCGSGLAAGRARTSSACGCSRPRSPTSSETSSTRSRSRVPTFVGGARQRHALRGVPGGRGRSEDGHRGDVARGVPRVRRRSREARRRPGRRAVPALACGGGNARAVDAGLPHAHRAVGRRHHRRAGRVAARRRAARPGWRGDRQSRPTSLLTCSPAPRRSAPGTGTTRCTQARWPGSSTRLFDLLAAEHGMGPRDRLLLEVAALLHDIGLFVSLRGHHKHSMYLLQASEIFGLSRDDMQIVGNIARYHRRGTPQKSHPEFMRLDRDERVRVTKLAACSGSRTHSMPNTSRRSPTSASRSRTRTGSSS